jgi:hypothetical protein
VCFCKWECCWFELRPSMPDGTKVAENCVHYYSSRHRDFKSFAISAIQREPSLDSAAGLVLSLHVPAHKGRLLLAAPSHDVLAELERIISRRAAGCSQPA